MAHESVDSREQKRLGQALRILRKRADLTSAQAAEAFGTGEENWRKYERGAAPSIFSPETQAKLAQAVRASRDDLLAENARISGDRPPLQLVTNEQQSWAQARAPELTLLPIRDTIQAGAWLVADDSRQDAATYPAAKDPRYPHAHQWLDDVRGDSCNKLNIVDGDLVHLVDAIDIGYHPRTGDVVEVERLRFGGQERELTLKQVEVTPDGILLWPRSTNPRWQNAIELASGLREAEEFEVRIRALVLASIRRF